ncbi:hypothetical protein F9K91_05130 [Brucella tritici]|uniref:YqaJ viral recombinase domain-containing protein n=2 Tax=Brucella tritici TaxID=94626 RepID=A0A833CPC4_9HYPH|nr:MULTISPECIES: YqaJ viral recombinase family protein [Brucella]KAB2666567.1 hypothetical protein F9K91_05130 [Brucella tritici]
MARAQYTSVAQWFWPRTEAGWHKLRKPDITATSAATLFGVSPYQTIFDMFHRMRGTVEVVIEESERMKWGKRLQDSIARGICDDNGWEIVDTHPYLYARSLIYPGMGASPDVVIRDPKRPELGLGGLEIKNVDLFVARDDWSEEEAPAHIEFQAQHQMAVCGFKWNVIAGLVGGNSVKQYVRFRDDEVIKELALRCADMHARVAANNPPPPDYLKDYETLRTVYRHAEPAKTFDIDHPDSNSGLEAKRVADLIAAKYDADIKLKLAKEDATRASAELLDYIKDTETVFGGGWKLSATTTFLEACTIERKATSFRNLRVSKPKQKAK